MDLGVAARDGSLTSTSPLRAQDLLQAPLPHAGEVGLLDLMTEL